MFTRLQIPADPDDSVVATTRDAPRALARSPQGAANWRFCAT